jgi:pteridine reductase
MKLALVTAGFRRLGGAIAARLAAEGWTLALQGRQQKDPEAQLAAALALHGNVWKGYFLELSDADAVEGLIPRIAADFGRLPDLIVNNASMFEYDDPATATALSMAQHHAVNVAAPVALALGLFNRLPADGRAAVINILDQRISQPNADQLSYTLSKQALAGATETLARALAPRIRVNGVAPGLTIPTDEYRPAQMVALEAMMPLARLPEPDDIADAVLWLAGAEATTGQTIFVDGGASLKSFDRDFVFLGE